MLRDHEALDHVLAHLKPGAHVVGGRPAVGAAVDGADEPFVLGAALYSVTSHGGPGAALDAARAGGWRTCRCRTRGFGGIYIATGRVSAPQRTPVGRLRRNARAWVRLAGP